MKKKLGGLGILLAVLLVLPTIAAILFSTSDYQGNLSNAQNVSAQDELKGVWIATVRNIDFPSKSGLTAGNQKAELDKILENAEYMGLNAVFFQVRPTGDALYKSALFPWSKYLTGKQGTANDQDFDPLAYLIEQGHKRGIKIHAWVNPLRLSIDTYSSLDKAIAALSPDHPARKLTDAMVLSSDGQLYLDPGNPEVIKLINEGVAEIVRNYDVDGIHFDDYFYPSKAGFNDNVNYEKYKGSYISKEDWRRSNIDSLVKSTYDTVKNIKPEVQFGISPFAIWANKDKNLEGSDTQGGVQTYYDHYADTKKWVKEAYLDYIAPQIYWNIGFKIADYSVLLDWWKNVCSGTSVKLYIGHAAYKINETSQAVEWLDPLQIPKQIAMNRASNAVSGSIFYGYQELKDNVLGIKDKLRGIYVAGRDPGSSIPEDRQLVISQPANGYTTSASKVSILGSCDPNEPLYLDGTEIEASQEGYFTLYKDLKVGINAFVFEHKGVKTELKVTRKATSSATYQMTKPEFRPGTLTPTQSITMKSGQKIIFSCQAPAGAKVWVEIGKYKVNMTTTNKTNSGANGTLTPVKYTGTFTVPAYTGNERVLSLGKPVFVMEYQGRKITSKQSNSISVQSSRYYKYAVISTTEAEAVARTGPSDSSSRTTPLINGAADYIIGQQNGYYLLRSGIWTDMDNVKVVNDKALPANKITSTSVKTNGSYTELTFKMPVNAIFDVTASSNTVTLTIYNTTGRKITAAAPASAVYSSASYTSVGGAAKYIFKLRSTDNYFGYYAQYKNGSLIFSLRNAPKISKTGSKPLTGLKVLLDAGHGGTEPGTGGPMGKYGLYEKQVNLAIALNARNYLQALGAQVVMTRTTDKTVSLTDRANMIRNEKPDIAVSVHNNAMDVTADYTKHTGLLVLYSKDGGKPAASFIKDQLVADLGRKDSGYRWQSLTVCTVTQSPAILIEGGFMTNPAEYEWLSSYDNQARIGFSLGKAIENWAYENTR